VLRRWPGADLSDDDAAAAAEILRLYGLGLLFAADWPTVERGRRLVAASFAVAGRVGRSVVSQQAWFLYVEALIYVRRAADVVPRITAAIRRLQEVGHGDAAVRLAELAVLQYSVGDHAAARSTVEIGMEWSDRTGYRIARPPLCAIDVALDVAEGGFTPERAARYDDVLVDMASQARLAFYVPAYAAEFGILLAARGAVSEAWRYLEQAEESVGSNLVAHLSSLRSRRLRGLLYIADGRPDEGRAVLEELRRDAVDERRAVLVERLDADLARRAHQVQTTRVAVVAVLVQVLGPQLTAAVDGEPVPSPRGYPAKLLALLVASGGVMTMDAAIEGLWPGADPDVGRNRLHGVLLRLRRSLGLPVTGPITCADGVVRLDRDGPVVVDSWEFEDAAGTGGPGSWDAVRRFPGEVLSHQFAYDDTIEAYRRELRSTFLRLASSLLADPPGGSDPEDVVAVAQRAWRLAPDDESLCLLAVDALLGHGRTAEARELVRGTEQALTDLGLDPGEFSRAAVCAFV
jgi:DNA-binding SARP family transcriptional activator